MVQIQTREHFAPLELIAEYYDACSSGDANGVSQTMCDDVTHWFLAPNIGSRAVHGAEQLGRYWSKVHDLIAPVWIVDHGITQQHESVIEWSMFWVPAGSDQRVVTRGAEWFVFRDRRIAEIRSYYRQEMGDSELDGFPYAEREYSVHGAERSARHTPALG
jgi:ketosteroid isomerase-like protein